jgi:hypothetical protein
MLSAPLQHAVSFRRTVQQRVLVLDHGDRADGQGAIYRLDRVIG